MNSEMQHDRRPVITSLKRYLTHVPIVTLSRTPRFWPRSRCLVSANVSDTVDIVTVLTGQLSCLPSMGQEMSIGSPSVDYKVKT